MPAQYMSLETLAVTLDMRPKAVSDYVARGMLPRPHRIGDEDRWAWSEVDNWIKRSQAGPIEDDPFLVRLRDAKAPSADARSHCPQQDGQTVHLLPTPSRNPKGRAPDSVA